RPYLTPVRTARCVYNADTFHPLIRARRHDSSGSLTVIEVIGVFRTSSHVSIHGVLRGVLSLCSRPEYGSCAASGAHADEHAGRVQLDADAGWSGLRDL